MIVDISTASQQIQSSVELVVIEGTKERDSM